MSTGHGSSWTDITVVLEAILNLGIPQDQSLEDVPTVFKIPELVERRATRGQQHHIALAGDFCYRATQVGYL